MIKFVTEINANALVGLSFNKTSEEPFFES